MAPQQGHGDAWPRLRVPNRGGLMSRPAQQLAVSSLKTGCNVERQEGRA